jgi:transitional endoplasmic reticulum ATPase
VEAEVSEPAQVARVSAVSIDAMVIWLELADGGTATATSHDEPFTIPVGTVMLVSARDNRLAWAPDEVWPRDADGEPRNGEIFVGVVRYRDDTTTIIDYGGPPQRVPSHTRLSYDVGYTVEATRGAGVMRVLSEKPLPLRDPPTLDEDQIIKKFLVQPTGGLSFDDFGGLEEVKRRARELIELPLQRADKLAAIGADPIRGVLFTGPPGTGKTMLARIIASTAEAKFYAISGPTVFSKWYGESEEILRLIFTHAAQNGPSIIFFDEIDSVAGQRDEDAHEASKRVVAQLLTLMDGLEVGQDVVVIAATNRPQDIDVALRRPGRFDWQIDFPSPSLADRVEILQVRAKSLTTTGSLPHMWVAANTDGWSAAELSAIWKEAALLAAADDRGAIGVEDYLGGYERAAAQRRRVLAALPQRGVS